jgi:hypothetical protein
MEGQNIISKRTRDAAVELLEYFRDHASFEEDCRKRLRQLADMPVMKPTNNPMLRMEFFFEHHRMGEFEKTEHCTLADYILIMCAGVGSGWSFGDVLGKHSEIDAPASEWEVDLAEDPERITLDKYRRWNWISPYNDDEEFPRKQLWEVCTTQWLDKTYTGIDNEEIPDWRDFKERFDAFVKKCKESS